MGTPSTLLTVRVMDKTLAMMAQEEYDLGNYRIRSYREGGGRVTHIPSGVAYEAHRHETILQAISKLESRRGAKDDDNEVPPTG